MGKRLVFDGSACVGCQACVAACCDCHDLTVGQQLLWVETHEEGRWYRDENGLAVMEGVRAWADCRLCRHCDEPQCVPQCKLGALSKGPDGVVAIDPDKCVGCGMCRKACPYQAIITVLRDPGEPGSKKRVSRKCDLCRGIPEGPQCAAACPMRCLNVSEDMMNVDASVNASQNENMEKPANDKPAKERLVTRLATMDEYAALCRFYDEVCEANAGSEFYIFWDRSIHPSDAMIEESIRTGGMYLGLLDGEIACASIVDDFFAPGYERMPWKVDADETQARCVHLFAVHPNFMRMGLGLKFLDDIAADARRRGFKALRLDVLDFNTPALRMYEKAGYEFIAETPLVYEDYRSYQWMFEMYELAL